MNQRVFGPLGILIYFQHPYVLGRVVDAVMRSTSYTGKNNNPPAVIRALPKIFNF